MSIKGVHGETYDVTPVTPDRFNYGDDRYLIAADNVGTFCDSSGLVAEREPFPGNVFDSSVIAHVIAETIDAKVSARRERELKAYRLWNSNVGTKVNARMLSRDEESLTLETITGKPITVKIADFSDQDIHFLDDDRRIEDYRAEENAALNKLADAQRSDEKIWREKRAEQEKAEQERIAEVARQKKAKADARRKAEELARRELAEEAKNRFEGDGGLIMLRDSVRANSTGFGMEVTGKIINEGRTKSYVQITFDVFDAEDNRVGTALDNINSLKKGETWKFKAHFLGDDGEGYRISKLEGF